MEPTIRPATTDAELEAWLDVRNAVDPRQITLAGLRAERSGDTKNLDLVAWDDGTAVGAGSIGWGPVGEESQNTFIWVWVLPAHRNRGTGGRLYDQLATFGRRGGIERVTGVVVEGDAAGLRFCEQRGLVIDGGGSLGRLDLTTLASDLPSATIDGVTLTTLKERPDLERPMYDLDMLVHPEIPFLANEPNPSFEAWHATGIEDPGFVADLSLIAVEAGHVIGAIQMYDNADSTLFIGMTSVHPDARRRGIARLLKVEMAGRAKAAGWRLIETYNDGSNERIRTLNESLGYLYDVRRVVLRGRLSTSVKR
jgi:GNAT superfamily N-acetyltransferase